MLQQEVDSARVNQQKLFLKKVLLWQRHCVQLDNRDDTTRPGLLTKCSRAIFSAYIEPFLYALI